MSLSAVIAVNRFGYGAKAGELEQAKQDPKSFLINQLQPISFNQDLPNSHQLLRQLAQYHQEKKQAKKLRKKTSNQAPLSFKKIMPFFRASYTELCADSIHQTISSSNSMMWRLLDFFSNHFSVSAQGPMMTTLAPTLEREAIAPYLLGSFSDMLVAVVHHPAMLKYLNNEQSFGPNSKAGKKGKGLNENLAREILELHTLGVNSGYTQEDVIELAKGISGWSIAKPSIDDKNGFYYRKRGHEPGLRRLLNKIYTEKGEAQGIAMLRSLAMEPKTAEHVCYKLARHFIADEPSRVLVKRLSERWLATQGNLQQVVLSLIDSPESWAPISQKFKSPREHLISTYRGLSLSVNKPRKLISMLTTLGQQPFKANSPKGYGDNELSWNGANALLVRIDWSVNVVHRKRNIEVKLLIPQLFGQQISERSYLEISRAESRENALVLLLMSRDFLRR
ncbi:DUF1800 domain-containing protein [Shewanella sp. D64]|uniref:DUF1800 domain-containing protein n=1 Tax=unclassified Shewanella TaxID=196818 RepID=UPI0022BA1EE8|nr:MULTISPECIES: DUF1800 domain-containing protein [unclassified Shewanella]MEC4724683.1 DUF1800 domain-containing protein [Shewanella sp. D64]MEC4736523.1 DUF1800 domain-containing protein [Shewanella sp. E94]WBJ97424.1 DUF1800 domain-containing protein [Shewanella sp. MTB7]